jgi:hypothetical protein
MELRSSDLPLVAYLLVSGGRLLRPERAAELHGRVTFVHELRDELDFEQLRREFVNGTARVAPLQFYQQLRALKNVVFGR